MTVPITIRLLALAWAVSAAVPCYADIWGFVDEQGIVSLANHQVDNRYILFRKEPEGAVAPPLPIRGVRSASELPRVMTELPRMGAEPSSPVAEQPRAAALPDHLAQPRGKYAQLVARISRQQGVDPALVHAVIEAESGYNSRARSPKGARGLMQLMPETAARYGVKDSWNAAQNIRGGAAYLRDLLRMFNSDLRLALAAYNAGEGAVMAAGNSIPAYPETRKYVPRVLQYLERNRAGIKM
jgi:soluble lytic murein transglycosylase-like protein